MSRVLDLDLDFFVEPIAHSIVGTQRLPEDRYSAADVEFVEVFLEQRCGLSKERRIPGRTCVEHVEAYDIWKEWLHQRTLTHPFEVVHIDAHADMGLGDRSFMYLLTEVLALPVHERDTPPRGPRGLNSGSYLAFAIANRIAEMTYVFPSHARRLDGYPSDVQAKFFRDDDWKHGPIELPHYSREQMIEVVSMTRSPPPPLSWEPPVPNHYVRGDVFQSEGFTHMILAQSPGFTPASADALLPIIRQYFDPC